VQTTRCRRRWARLWRTLVRPREDRRTRGRGSIARTRRTDPADVIVVEPGWGEKDRRRKRRERPGTTDGGEAGSKGNGRGQRRPGARAWNGRGRKEARAPSTQLEREATGPAERCSRSPTRWRRGRVVGTHHPVSAAVIQPLEAEVHQALTKVGQAYDELIAARRAHSEECAELPGS